MKGRIRRASGGFLLLLVGVVALGACIPSGPTYPVDFFHEMHYTQVYRQNEPPRLAPAPEAVPITGRAPARTMIDAPQLVNPVVPTAEVLEHGRELYTNNCAMCHGAQGRGDGIIAAYFRAANTRVPADLTSPAVQQRADGELYVLVSQGTGPIAVGAGVMPPFGNLLTSEEIWTLVAYMRTLQ